LRIRFVMCALSRFYFAQADGVVFGQCRSGMNEWRRIA
jgi:hypothetical protein